MREIQDVIANEIKKQLPKGAILGTVISGSYNSTEGTVDVQPVNDDAQILDVRIQANFEVNKGFVCIPSNGSYVMVMMISDNDGYLSMVSQVDEIVLYSTSLGGLVTVETLTTKLNNLENKVNAIIAAYNIHTHSGVTAGGAITGVTSGLVSGTLTPTVRTDIENIKILHGNT